MFRPRAFKDIKRKVIAEFERSYLRHLLEQSNCDIAAVQRLSGLSRRRLSALLLKHGL